MGKKITFLTPYFSGARGNVTTSLRIVEGYRKEGFEVQIFAYTEGGS